MSPKYFPPLICISNGANASVPNKLHIQSPLTENECFAVIFPIDKENSTVPSMSNFSPLAALTGVISLFIMLLSNPSFFKSSMASTLVAAPLSNKNEIKFEAFVCSGIVSMIRSM